MNDSPHLHHQIYICSSRSTEDQTLLSTTGLIIELEYINLHDNIKTFVEHFSFRWGISIDEEANLRVNWLYGIGSIFLSTENIKKNGGRRGEVRDTADPPRVNSMKNKQTNCYKNDFGQINLPEINTFPGWEVHLIDKVVI